MANVDINKLIIQLRTRISELEYDNMVKNVLIEQLQESLEDKNKDLPDESDSAQKPVSYEVVNKQGVPE